MKYICILILFEYYIGKMKKWNGGMNTKTTNSTKTTNH